MIRQVTLRNWKAYDSLDLELQPGTTFVVAKNGIGKSSLIQGASWCLFGSDLLPFDPVAAIRAGKSEAEATVTLELPGNRTATIERRISHPGGRSVVTLNLDGETSSDQEAVMDLLRSYGAAPSFLARTAFLQEGRLFAEVKAAAEGLEEHLMELLGLGTLRDVISEVARVGRQLGNQNSKFRAAQREGFQDRQEEEDRLGQLTADEEALRARRDEVKTAHARALSQSSLASQWVRFDELVQERAHSLERLADEVEEFLGRPVPREEALKEFLVEAEGISTERVQSLRAEETTAVARERQIRAFMEELNGREGACPVCLRPISPDEASHAIDQHQDQIGALQQEAVSARERREREESKLTKLRGFRDAFQELGVPVAPTEERPKGVFPSEELDRLARELQEINERIGAAARERENLQALLSEDAALRELSNSMLRGYRREFLASLLHSTMVGTKDKLIAEQLSPLARQVASQWKSIWSDRAPIQLSPRGDLVSTRFDREIPFAQFSGGERVVSVLLIRILSLIMTTDASFLWLDEPLEHLDVRNRRMVASLLVKTSSAGQLRQVLATTYEEAVARRLADQAQNAHLVYVSADPS